MNETRKKYYIIATAEVIFMTFSILDEIDMESEFNDDDPRIIGKEEDYETNN
jgi:hypothetical protein